MPTLTRPYTHTHTHHSRLATERELPSLLFNGWKVRGSYTTEVEKFRCAHSEKEEGGTQRERERCTHTHTYPPTHPYTIPD